jgi:hypothetical protein|tara:strand:- start:1429 stop:2088 length:660 start_codon:yes stop_codon:yes gene_type:complete
MVLTREFNISNVCPEKINQTPRAHCYFCGGTHVCRECPQETAIAPILKKYIGSIMEEWVGKNFPCPCCKSKSLSVLGNHSPSLDIICSSCNRKFEVKSKCLSINRLPNDINLPHGNFEDYQRRQQNGLDLIVIIYKVDRLNKKITIREVLYAKNSEIKKSKNIQVIKRIKSHLSTIIINNKNLLSKFNLKKLYQFDFSAIIDNYVKTTDYIKNLNEMTI